jgi:hypothetical protein
MPVAAEALTLEQADRLVGEMIADAQRGVAWPSIRDTQRGLHAAFLSGSRW